MNIKPRNIAVAIILSFVTCGIYAIYWVVMLVREALAVKDPSDGGILELVLSLFLPFIGFYLTEKKFAEGCAARGIAHKDNSVLYLVLGICCGWIIPAAMMQNDLNKIAEQYPAA